jgi:hypothetical protein
MPGKKRKVYNYVIKIKSFPKSVFLFSTGKQYFTQLQHDEENMSLLVLKMLRAMAFLLLLLHGATGFTGYHYVKVPLMSNYGITVPPETTRPDQSRVLFWPQKPKTCLKMQFDPKDVIVIDEAGGLQFYAVSDVSNPVLNDQSLSFPATEIESHPVNSVYVCCNDCDFPFQTTPQAIKIFQVITGFKIFAVYCSAASRGKTAQCPCYSQQAQNCSVGTYRANCRLDYVGDCVPCTNGAGESLDAVTYTSAGGATKNDCDYQCAPGFFFDLASSTCRRCRVCQSGYYVVRQCLQLVSRASAQNLDTECLKCQLGYTTNPIDNRFCVACGFGFRAADDTAGCVACSTAQYTVSLNLNEKGLFFVLSRCV